MQDLNLKARRILESVYNNGGEATTSEIKELTGIENSATVKYHAEDVLGDSGLVTSRVEATEDHPGGMRHIEITEEGRERIAHLFDGSEDIPIKDRMEDIESRFRETEDHVSELVGEVHDLRADIEEYGEGVEQAEHRAERAVEIAEDARDVFDVLREDISKTVEDLQQRVERIENRRSEEIDEFFGQLDEVDTALEDLDLRLKKIEGVEVDSGEEVSEKIDNSEVDTPGEAGGIDSKTSKIVRYIEQLDPRDYGIEYRTDLIDHMNDRFNLTSKELRRAIAQADVPEKISSVSR